MSKEYNSCEGLTPQQALNELCEDLSISNAAECENQKDLEFSKLWVRQHKELIEKSLKALDVIKEKEVDIFILKGSKTLKAYNQLHKIFCGKLQKYKKLTKKEYELLKEVLGNE